MMESEADKFVTVVAVEAAEEYVTVLSVGGGEQDGEDVLVYRLPGERLGFGLKFEGGTATGERVRRLFIQSCAPDSPASRVTCSWGTLQEGDEVLQIDSVLVNMMTRLDCVRCLKDSNVVLKLRVRHAPPPPVPPRRSKDRPPEPEVYLDLLAQEAAACLTESESDDTGSSISTVVIDIAKVLSPFEQLERELDDEGGTPLQPPLNFQDAPLSYGDEKVLPPKPAPRRDVFRSGKKRPPPPPPPRSDRPQCPLNVQTIAVEDADLDDLPRLVDVVPKSETDGEARPPITEGRECFPEGEGTLSLIVGKSSERGKEVIEIKEYTNSFMEENLISEELKTHILEVESSVDPQCDVSLETESNHIVPIESEEESLSSTDEFQLVDLKTEDIEIEPLDTNNLLINSSHKLADSKIPIKQSKETKLVGIDSSKSPSIKNEQFIFEKTELRSENRKSNNQHSLETTDGTCNSHLATEYKDITGMESVENKNVRDIENKVPEKDVVSGSIEIKTEVKDYSEVCLFPEMKNNRSIVREINIKEEENHRLIRDDQNVSNEQLIRDDQNISNEQLCSDMSEKERNEFTVIEKEEIVSEITQNEENETGITGQKEINAHLTGNEETRQTITNEKEIDSRKIENKSAVVEKKDIKPENPDCKQINSESLEKEERIALSVTEKKEIVSRIPVPVQEREEIKPAIIGKKEKGSEIIVNQECGLVNKVSQITENRPAECVEMMSNRGEIEGCNSVATGIKDSSTKISENEQVTGRKDKRIKIYENEQNRPIIVGSVEIKSKMINNGNRPINIERKVTGCKLLENEENRPVVIGGVEMKDKKEKENKSLVTESKQIKSNTTEHEEIRPYVIGSNKITSKVKQTEENKSTILSCNEIKSKVKENGENREMRIKLIENENKKPVTFRNREIKPAASQDGNNTRHEEKCRPPVEGNKESKSRIPVLENEKSRIEIVENKEAKSGISQEDDLKFVIGEKKEGSRTSGSEKTKLVVLSRKEIVSKISHFEENRCVVLGRRENRSEYEKNQSVIVGSKGLDKNKSVTENKDVKNNISETNGKKPFASQINTEVSDKQKEKTEVIGNKFPASDDDDDDDDETRPAVTERETILFSTNDSDSDEDFVLELPEWGGGSVFQPGVGFRCWGLATIGEDEEDSDNNMVSGLSAVSEEDEDSSADSLPLSGNPKKGLTNGCTPDAQLVTTVMEDTQLRRLPPDGHEFPPSYTEHIPTPPEPVIEVEKPPPPLPASEPPTMIKPTSEPLTMIKPTLEPPTMIKPTSEPPTMIKSMSEPPAMIKSTAEPPTMTKPTAEPPTMMKPSVRVPSWRKDEKSECSVRDKIAMFSSAAANLDRSPSTSGLFPTPEKTNVDRSSGSFSQYSLDRSPISVSSFPVPERSPSTISHFSVPEKLSNVDGSPSSVGYFSVLEKSPNLDLDVYSSPEKVSSVDYSSSSLGMFPLSSNKTSNMERTHSLLNVYTTADSKSNLDRTHSSLDLSYTPGTNYSTLPRKPSAASSTIEGVPRLTRTSSFSGPSSLHTRSQSLIDIGRGTMEDMRKASLNALIEQRRRGMSKLRGLVIPEKISEIAAPSPSICDLPEIRSRDSIFVKNSYASTTTQRPNISATSRWSTGPCVFNTTSTTTTTTTTTNSTPPSIMMPSPPWKAASNTNNLPKYSPAFKRKSLTVYGTSTAIKDEPPASLESITSPARSDLSFEYKTPMGEKNSTVGHHNSAEDDSDTDSAVSSSRSSISPPPTPPPPPLLSPLHRTLSSETTASASSSTASTITCGSSDSSRRVLKAQSVEAINRKNVLSSARYSSGKDIKVGSPLIQRKFDEDERRIAYVTDVVDPEEEEGEEEEEEDEEEEEEEEEKPALPKPLPAPRRAPVPPKPVQRKTMEVNPEEEADLLSVLMGGRLRRQRTKDNMLSDDRRSVSVHDIRKTFETAGRKVNHARVSSLDSTASEDSFTPQYGSVGNLHREQFGSVTSIASSTSLISPQELQVLIDEANQPLDDCDVVVVVLHREGSTGSVGITLAGGADYEAKEITVHKVLAGSPADRDGRIQKGDRILSINGRSMKGVTHRESLNILKAPRSEVVLVVSRSRCLQEPNQEDECTVAAQIPRTTRPPRIPEQPAEIITMPSGEERGPPITVTLTKDGAGLGFSLEGGKESPLGDMPLTIKKIFTGGSAEKNGELCAGDELLIVNGTDVTLLSRIEAWGLMKRLPDGPVSLTVRHRLNK